MSTTGSIVRPKAMKIVSSIYINTKKIYYEQNLFVCLILVFIAFCGEVFDFSFDLPFTDFLPPNIPLKFWIQVMIIYLQVNFILCTNKYKIYLGYIYAASKV